MSQINKHAGGPRLMLDARQFDRWQRANMDAFDRLPDDVRMAIRETGVEVDCAKIERALQLGVPIEIVCETILTKGASQRQAGLRPSLFKGARVN
jgi:hypothetical protein